MEASGGFESGHGSCETAGVHCRCCSVPGQSWKAVSNSMLTCAQYTRATSALKKVCIQIHKSLYTHTLSKFSNCGYDTPYSGTHEVFLLLPRNTFIHLA